MSNTDNTLDTRVEPAVVPEASGSVILEKGPRGRAWIWTWNNYTEENFEKIKNYCKTWCDDYAVNPEIGENGTPHLQGFWYFTNARQFSKLKKDFPQIHLELAVSKFAAKKYCMKDETKAGETFTKNEAPKVIDPLGTATLRSWQKDLLENLDKIPDNRTIIWVFDPEGGAGKTSLAKHLCLKYPNECLYLTGGPQNCKYGVTSFLYTKKKNVFIRNSNNLRIVIFDYTRSQDETVSYQAIEEIKNGIFYNTKYESMMVMYNCPHVVIFSNFYPDLNRLSSDRWNIIDLGLDNLM